jgi:hypothetical protein
MREGFGAPPEMRERREQEPLRRSYEYRDVEGRLIGRAEVALDAEETELPPDKDSKDAPVKARRLRSFALHGEKDGAPTRVDMLGLDLVHGDAIGVYVASERLDNYDYDDEKKRATVPPLETPTDVGVYLHELGHASQHHETRFADVADLYGAEKDVYKHDQLDLAELRKTVREIRDAVPDAEGLLTDAQLDELSEIEAEMDQKEREHVMLLGAMAKEANKKKPNDDAVEELKRKADAAEAEGAELAEELKDAADALGIADFVAIPTSIMERDATRRAFEWARKIRAEAGVDLFARHAAPAEATARATHAGGCERSVVEGIASGTAERVEETDIREDLKRSLASYGADRLRLRNPDRPDDIAITPTVGKRRRKK